MILMAPDLNQSKMASTIPEGLPNGRVAPEKWGRQVRRDVPRRIEQFGVVGDERLQRVASGVIDLDDDERRRVRRFADCFNELFERVEVSF